VPRQSATVTNIGATFPRLNGFAREGFKAINRKHQINKRCIITSQLVHPQIGLWGGNARWLPIAAILNGNIPGLLPLKSLAFKLDLLNLLVLKNVRQTALIQQCLIKLKIEFPVAIEADFRHSKAL
jgi:hypothetical protein